MNTIALHYTRKRDNETNIVDETYKALKLIFISN